MTTTPSVFSTALAYCQMPLATLAVAVACGIRTWVLEKSPLETTVAPGAIAVAAATMLSVPALTSERWPPGCPISGAGILADAAFDGRVSGRAGQSGGISIGVDVDRRLGQDDRGRSAFRDSRLRDRSGDGALADAAPLSATALATAPMSMVPVPVRLTSALPSSHARTGRCRRKHWRSRSPGRRACPWRGQRRSRRCRSCRC